MHGVTGRMGMNQHLIRSIVAIRKQGGVTLSNGDKVMPDPILIGRNAEKIEALARAHGITRWGTDLDEALKNRDDSIFFDAGITQMRPTLLAKAIRAGKHVYCEKPIATNLNEAVEIARLAEKSGLKHGAVQDKLFLPGLRKLDMLRRAGFFGKMLSVRLEFGYWVFEGDLQPIQRPSWNYRTEDGGGMILDHCHPRHVDALAARRPELTVIAARPAWPWQEEMIAVMIHKPNVWCELHGWSPKYLTESLKRDLSRRLKNRVMFGADYPLFTYERLVADWRALGYDEEILGKLFHRNAEALFAKCMPQLQL